jgi:hypothetical protein
MLSIQAQPGAQRGILDPAAARHAHSGQPPRIQQLHPSGAVVTEGK